ncbi:uridine kinase [Brevibacterium oceani]|uniref:uridine kinase n=1 Tax=Brevibacterium oceani TaxID=358099 RepID=UPI0015E637F4|nr:uridine kinase [Brevibacterium oceani]
MTVTRQAVLRELLDHVRSVRRGGRALIAVDGLDGAGKSVLVSELIDLASRDDARPPAEDNRPLACVSIDGFHRPRSVRYAEGRGPESFYRDSYDYPAFVESVVEPFRTGEAIAPAVWDVDADEPVAPDPLNLPDDCVLLVDGIFLHRPELRDHWDASVWIEVPFAVSVPRGNARFPHLNDADPESESNRRYVGGQRLYFAEAAPWDRATWNLDNTDLDRPNLIR